MMQKKNSGKLEILNFKYSYPMGWEELSRRQLLRIFKAMAKFGPDSGLFVLSLIWHALRLKRRVFQDDRTRFIIKELPSEDKITIAHSPNILGWFFNMERYPMPYIFRWFFLRGRLYVGPYRRLTKLETGELCNAMWYHQEYHDNQNPEDLQRLIAVLYRPVSIWKFIKRCFSSNPNGDIRKPINDFLHETRAKRLRKLPSHKAAIILAMWGVAQKEFAAKHKLTFKRSGKSSKKNPRDMVKFIISMAGDKFGTVEKTDKMPADLVYQYVEMQMEEAALLKQKLKKSNG
jgi:hypothetical protein